MFLLHTDQKTISCLSRLVANTSMSNVYCSVDGTDFPINESHPFSPKWFSYKFNGPGVRYEIGVCMRKGITFWCNESLAHGSNNYLCTLRIK